MTPWRRNALAREELEDAAGARHFADAFRQVSCPSARQQAAELILAREQREPTLSRTSLRTSGLALGPRGQRRFGGLHGVIHRRAPSSEGARATISRVSEGFRPS